MRGPRERIVLVVEPELKAWAKAQADALDLDLTSWFKLLLIRVRDDGVDLVPRGRIELPPP